MYSIRGNIILAFHGCDKSVCERILSDPHNSLRVSTNKYDWLGNGVYFWENNYDRALKYAQQLKNNPPKSKNPIKEPSVIGAILNLGHCLDLVDSQSLEILKAGYQILKATTKKSEFESLINKKVGGSEDLLLRDLDCAVIETVHQFQAESGKRPFDAVRGVFFEGDDLYPGAGFKEKNHIQICVRNPNCIKGYFLPRKANPHFIVP